MGSNADLRKSNMVPFQRNVDIEKKKALDDISAKFEQLDRQFNLLELNDADSEKLWDKYIECLQEYDKLFYLCYPDMCEQMELYLSGVRESDLPFYDYKQVLPDIPIAAFSIIIPDMIKILEGIKNEGLSINYMSDFFWMVWDENLYKYQKYYKINADIEGCLEGDYKVSDIAKMSKNDLLMHLIKWVHKCKDLIYSEKSEFLRCNEIVRYFVKELEYLE